MAPKFPSVLVRRTFKPGSRPPSGKREDHIMLRGGREGPGAVDLPPTTGWDGEPSERYTAHLRSRTRSEETPTQSTYLIRVRPELRGWQRGISTVAEMEQAALPLSMTYPLPTTALNVPLGEPRPVIELTFLTTQEFVPASDDPGRMVSREIQATAVPLILRPAYSQFVADTVIDLVPSDGVRQVLYRIYKEDRATGLRRIELSKQDAELLDIPYYPNSQPKTIAALKRSPWYQRFVGVVGQVQNNPGEFFFPYSLIARLRQVYSERAGYPPVVSAEPSSEFDGKHSVDTAFISRWGPELYTLVMQDKITPEEAILRLRSKKRR